MIPLAGQGTPLPLDCPYRGEWLLKNRLFLYRPDDAHAQVDSPQFTAGFQRADGEWCAGFDAAVLAKALGTGIDALFDANRNGLLTLAGVEEVSPQYGGTAAKQYTFMLGNKVSILTIEAIESGGNA